MALTQVSSKGIKDATLLNEDVNASANIAGSKLADNSISLAKLVHGDSNNNGKFLRANNGADPSFETITGTTINNNADNRLITGSGSANTLEGEANATFNGQKLAIGPLDGGADVVLNVRNTNSGGYGAYISGGSGTNYILRLDDKDQNNMFRFNANGKLGIGTATPTGQIHLYQAGNDPYIYIQRGSGDTSATIGGIFWRNSTNNLALIDAQSADIDAGRMRFYVNKNGTLTESLKIDEYGNLEVLDASEARLQVKTPSNGIIALRADGTNTQLGTWSNHDMHIIRNNSIQATLNDTGIAFPSGKGISFAATGDAGGMTSELFDDYEEGTWTPTCVTGTLNYGHTTYTKIGRMCYITTYVNNFSDRSSSSAIEITSLPYAPANESDCGACVFYRVAHTDEGQVAARTSTSGNKILFLVSSQGGSESWFHLTHSDLNHANSQIKFSIWYAVA